MVSSQRTTAAASTSTNNSSVRFDVPAHLKRSGMKTMNVVQLVESSSSLEAPPILRKSRRLVASTLLDALDDRIRKRKWQAALKVWFCFMIPSGEIWMLVLAKCFVWFCLFLVGNSFGEICA